MTLFHSSAQVDGHRQRDDKRGSAHQMSGGCDSGDVSLIIMAADHVPALHLLGFPLTCINQLPHQQHAWCGAFPHQLPVSVLREPLPSHRARGPQWGALRGAGDQSTRGPHVQAPGAADADGPGAGF